MILEPPIVHQKCTEGWMGLYVHKHQPRARNKGNSKKFCCTRRLAGCCVFVSYHASYGSLSPSFIQFLIFVGLFWCGCKFEEWSRAFPLLQEYFRNKWCDGISHYAVSATFPNSAVSPPHRHSYVWPLQPLQRLIYSNSKPKIHLAPT